MVDENVKEYLSDTSIKRGQIKFWAQRLAASNARRDIRIQQSRDMLLGNLIVPIPEKMQNKIAQVIGSTNTDRDAMRARLPQGTVVPLKTVNVLQRKRPRLKRKAIGITIPAKAEATKIEQWVNAALESNQSDGKSLFDWGKAVHLLFNEGEGACVVSMIDAHWEKVPSFEMVLEGKDDTKSVRSIYSRDSRGRRKTNQYYKKNKEKKYIEDHTKSKDAYDEILTDFMARNLPFMVQVIHATDCFPIWGNNDSLQGMIIRRIYDRKELIKRNYIWGGQDTLTTHSLDNQYSSGPEVTVYELFAYNENGEPFWAVEVDGEETKKILDDNTQVEAKVNLYQEYGLTRLPCTYQYGWHFDMQDPQDRGVPFIYPFIRSLLGVDCLATATIFHTWWGAFGGIGYVPDPNLPAEAWLFEGKPRTFDLEPMTAIALPGQVQDLKGGDVGQDVHRMISLLAGAVEQEIPGGGGQAFGGGAAQSGHDRSLMRTYLEDSVSQTLLGAKTMYEFAGEIILELACNLTETDDISIPVYESPEHGMLGKNKSELQTQIIELDPGDAGIVYDLTAFFPTKHGEFLAQGEQLRSFVKDELATFEEFREMVFGDEQPEETRIAIIVDKLLFQTPIGQQYVMELAMEYLGEGKMKEMMKLQLEQQMTQGGTPVAALSGLFPGTPTPSPQQMGGANSGSIPGNAASSLGGIAQTGQQPAMAAPRSGVGGM